MEKNKKFLTILLLMLGVGLTISTDISAQKKGKSSKSKSKAQSKAKKKSNSSSSRNESANSSTNADENTTRALNSTTTTSTTSSTSTTTTTTSTYSEEDEIENLTEKLKDCVYAQCAGDVAFEKCFKTGQVDSFISSNSICQEHINNASNDNIVRTAKNNLRAVIQNYLKTACTEAGGKVTGTTCKFDIYYQAKGPDGQKSRSGVYKTFAMGSTFTCNYSNFGLNKSDIEYKEEATSEQKMAMITAGIELGMSALNSTIQIVDAVNTSKKLKEKSRYMHDAWYKFDGTNLTVDTVDVEYKYGPKGKEKELEENRDYQCDIGKYKEEKKSDDEGSYYNACWKSNNNSKTTKSDECNDKITFCEKDGTPVGCKNECYVYIDKATPIKVSEKLSELMRTIGDLEGKRQNAELAQQFIGIAKTEIATKTAQNLANTYGTTNNNMTVCQIRTLENTNNSYGTAAQAINELMKNNPTLTFTESKCRLYNSNWKCVVMLENNSLENFEYIPNNCQWIDNDWKAPLKTTSTETPSSKQLYAQTLYNQRKNDTKGNTFLKELNNDVSDYNKALNTYNTNQTKLNEQKKELEELREKSNSSISNIASQATQALMGSGMTMLTTGMAMKENKGLMTGACYLGNPDQGGSILINEGEAKKLTWKLFN